MKGTVMFAYTWVTNCGDLHSIRNSKPFSLGKPSHTALEFSPSVIIAIAIGRHSCNRLHL